MEIGFQKVLPGRTDPVCQKTWSSPYLSYYWILEDAENVQLKDCYPINSAEINTDTRFREYTDSNGNGVFNWFNASDNYNKTVLVTNQIGQLIDPEYSTITYAETYAGTVSGHTIWGTTITQNNWMDGNHNWNYQTDASGNHLSGCSGNGCPSTGGIEWYWEDGKYPHDTGSAGGTMDNCLYASYGPYPYCTIGRQFMK